MHSRVSGCLALGAAAALTLFAAVSTDYDHHADFARYHTYSWIGVKAGNGLWQQRIQDAVDQQLAAKGWSKVPSGGDAAVSAFGRVTQQETLQTYYDGFPEWGWAGWGGTSTTEAIPENVGNLTVNIFDAGSKKMIWRGQASDVLSSKPEKNDKKMDEAVSKMFDHFPPKERG